MPGRNVLWADQAKLGKNLSGKVYIVTGANSGVGLETTRQLNPDRAKRLWDLSIDVAGVDPGI